MGIAADQIREANTNVDDVVKLVDVGGGVAGLPAIDASKLLNIPIPSAGGSSKDSPGEHFLGTILDYSASAKVTVSTVQYTRVYLLAGTVITKMRCFIDTLAAGNVRMGLYDQATPSSTSGTPRNRVAQTNATATAAGYVSPSLTANYTVTTSGYYWVAWISDVGSAKFVSSAAVFAASFLPRREEVSTGTTLPATAGVLTNPASAVIYAAAVE